MRAPEILSVFDNPEETLSYCNEFKSALVHDQVEIFVDFATVRRFSSDALLLIRALMRDERRGVHITIGGNLPSEPAVAAKLKASGFFDGFARPPGELPPPAGLLVHEAHREVIPLKASSLLQFARQHSSIDDAVARASNNALIESMANTHDHAAGSASPLRWFASVYCEDGVAFFTFVDVGMGILKTAPAQDYLRILGFKTMPLYGRCRLLQDVFMGRVGSRTKLPGRGKGLPKLRAHAQSGELPNLGVVTSRVLGRLQSDDFSAIESPTHGTVIRWQSEVKIER